MANRVAVLLDGGYVRVRLERALRRFPEPTDVMAFTEQILLHPRLVGSELLRVYYYDAPPIGGTKPNPLSRRAYDFEANPERALNQKLQAGLASTADVAVRRGEVVFRGWRVRQPLSRNSAGIRARSAPRISSLMSCRRASTFASVWTWPGWR